MMRAYERFLKYVTFDTQSDEKSGTTPSSEKQRVFAECLKEELLSLGVSDVSLDGNSYVMCTLEATEGYENVDSVGFIAHMDTSPDFCGAGVKVQIIDNYDGGEIKLGDGGKVLSPDEFTHLPSLKGRCVITTDGTTLLGADDKAGIAEIMTAVERIITEKIPHGKISFGFTPDEEIGEGADHFDVHAFGTTYAYTMDGGRECEIEYENFNAFSAKVFINGKNIHPGEAKDKMINASLVAFEFNSMLPSAEIPAHTEGYEGFYHLCSVNGCCENCTLDYIIRDHNDNRLSARIATLYHIEKILNEKYGTGTVKLTLREQYRNMAEIMEEHPEVIRAAKASIRSLGYTPLTSPIRGGTDGARISFMGIPCPNLGTGGYAFHGPYEHVTVEGMDISVDVILGIIKYFREKDNVQNS